jgi:nucleoside diphosphate kinase
MHGLPTTIECKPPKELSSVAVDVKKIGEINKFYQQAMLKLDKLQGLETKLEEVRKKKEDAGQKIKELNKQIEEGPYSEVEMKKDTLKSRL